MARSPRTLDVNDVPSHVRRTTAPEVSEIRIPTGVPMKEVERIVIEETKKVCRQGEAHPRCVQLQEEKALLEEQLQTEINSRSAQMARERLQSEGRNSKESRRSWKCCRPDIVIWKARGGRTTRTIWRWT